MMKYSLILLLTIYLFSAKCYPNPTTSASNTARRSDSIQLCGIGCTGPVWPNATSTGRFYYSFQGVFTSSYKIFLMLSGYYISTSSQLNFSYIIQDRNNTGATITLKTNNAQNINWINLRTLVVANNLFPDSSTSISQQQIQDINENITQSTPFQYTLTNLKYFNNDGIVKTFFSLQWFITQFIDQNGYWDIFDLELNVVQLNSTAVRITVSTSSTTNYIIYQIAFCWLTYNQQLISATNTNITIKSISQYQYSYQVNITNGFNYNTAFGAVLLPIRFQSSFNFQIRQQTVTYPNKITWYVSEAPFTFNYIVIQNLGCPSTAPYYLADLKYCEIACSRKYDQNQSQLTCILTPDPNNPTYITTITSIGISRQIIIGIAASFSILAIIILLCLMCACIKCMNQKESQNKIKYEDGDKKREQNSQLEIRELQEPPQDIFPPSIEVCSICLTNKCFFRTSCGHFYHQNCLQDWIDRRDQCPYCAQSYNPCVIFCKKCCRETKFVRLTPEVVVILQDSPCPYCPRMVQLRQ